MPSKKKTLQKPAQTLSDLLLSSDSDESTAEEAIVVRDDSKKKSTNGRQMPPKQAASRARKPPPPTAARRASARPKKKAEESEPVQIGTTEDEETDDIEEVEEVPARRGRLPSKKPQTAAAKKASTAARAKGGRAASKANAKADSVSDGNETGSDGEASVAANTMETDGEDETIKVKDEPKAGKSAAGKKAPSKKMTRKEREAEALAEKEIAETQYTPMDVDGTEDDQEGEVDEVASALPPPKPASRKRAASVTQQPAAKKATPLLPQAGDGNAAVEDALREELAEMTRRFEETDRRLKELTKLKYTDAETALVEFRKAMEARIATSERLNAALQDDLNAYQNLGAANKALKNQLAAKDTQISGLNNRVAELEKDVYASQNEIQSLTAKLTVARQAASAPPQVPGSAVKPKRELSHVNGHGPNAAAGSLPWEAIAKEELYGDLTALTVLGVKIFPDQPQMRVYDCIQTGKNGTLHFKLTTPVTMVGDEDEITFTPHLDPERDAKILSLLPEYLTEEITFARQNATRFYLKLLGVVLRNEPGRQQTVESEQ